MTALDRRLAACADMVTGGFAADIGTDHGYLPSYLVRNGICSRAIAADINAAPLAAARRTVTAEGTSDRVQLILSDGLRDVPLDGVTDIILAGMGGELISRIVLEDERCRETAVICQPMTKAEVLRREMWSHGYALERERAVISGKHIYSVMRWRYTGGEPYDDADVYIGKLSYEDETDRKYIDGVLRRLTAAAEGRSISSPEEAAALRALITMIEGRIGHDSTGDI
ncbi:MAG: SAM-dependent methyltransferase [Oscillospiraceae bacterium]|nr:SAM-dependent methyltransferase [Oscillospiraceae bacterium]